MNHVIFDLDGTLFDSMWVWENIDIEFFKRYGRVPDKKLRRKVKKSSVKQSAELFKKELNLPQSVEEIMAEFAEMGKESYLNHVTLKPYVFEFLQKLKNDGAKMCIATASFRENAIPVLKKLGIIDFFEFVMTADDVSTGKDDPEIFLKCAFKLGAAPHKVTVFEDSIHAIITAKSVGFKVIGVKDKSAFEDEDMITKICDKYIESYAELL